jgi:hypothetical protein
MPETWHKAYAGLPAFSHLRPWLDRLPDDAWPDLTILNDFAARQNLTNAGGLPLRFTSQTSGCGQLEYELGIHASGNVPSRERNWHDLFNALAWLAFPATKAALNATHQTALLPGCNRMPASDAATLFDESGLLLIGEDDRLIELLAARRWRQAFVDRKRLWAQVGAYVIGHAVLEKLVRPWPGITAKCLFLKLPPDTPLAIIDAALALSWKTSAIVSPGQLFPLPVLGILGWWPANLDGRFYDDTRYFRPPPSTSRAP